MLFCFFLLVIPMPILYNVMSIENFHCLFLKRAYLYLIAFGICNVAGVLSLRFGCWSHLTIDTLLQRIHNGVDYTDFLDVWCVGITVFNRKLALLC